MHGVALEDQISGMIEYDQSAFFSPEYHPDLSKVKVEIGPAFMNRLRIL